MSCYAFALPHFSLTSIYSLQRCTHNVYCFCFRRMLMFFFAKRTLIQRCPKICKLFIHVLWFILCYERRCIDFLFISIANLNIFHLLTKLCQKSLIFYGPYTVVKRFGRSETENRLSIRTIF